MKYSLTKAALPATSGVDIDVPVRLCQLEPRKRAEADGVPTLHPPYSGRIGVERGICMMEGMNARLSSASRPPRIILRREVPPPQLKS